MKEHYIKQVKRELLISRRQKNDVLRDLDEVFTSAMEHGETEQQVIERLGSPKDFAISTEEQLGIDRTALRKRNNIFYNYFNRCICFGFCTVWDASLKTTPGWSNRAS